LSIFDGDLIKFLKWKKWFKFEKRKTLSKSQYNVIYEKLQAAYSNILARKSEKINENAEFKKFEDQFSDFDLERGAQNNKIWDV
jgi:hypothetical protein